MSSSMSKIFQRLKPKTRFCEGGIHLSWPSPPVTPRQHRFPRQVPNIINPSEHPLTLFESTYYLLAPKDRGPERQRQKPWIVRVEEVDPTTWRLLNPLCGISGLFEKTNPPIMGRITSDPSNYLIKELATSYTLVDDHSEEKRLEKKASKVIPSTCMNQSEEVKLLAIDWDKKLYLWQQGDEYWTHILDDDDNRYGFLDIVSCKGKFYAVDQLGRFFEIDPTKSVKEKGFSKIISAPEEDAKYYKRLLTGDSDSDSEYNAEYYKRLLMGDSEYNGRVPLVSAHKKIIGDYYNPLLMGEYNGQVYLVLRSDEENIYTYVLEDGHGREPQKWRLTANLNNNVLFILNEVSFYLQANVLEREFEGNWVCFIDDLTKASNPNDSFGYVGEIAGTAYDSDHNVGLKGLKSLVYPCYYKHFARGGLSEEVKCFYSLSDHEYVSLFFPPPPWIQYYALDDDKTHPCIRFDKCMLEKYEFF
ncbi:F-box protein SKIP23-like [Silene latifolia]|uniref:F-box protein SKIP23-like n=1 Tax=Silene latifolia TaxID=37657 RepID=UPI003D77670A